ncbi:MAG: hypothetical protein P1U68_05780 [Verrucomicrobiales bacterium]|nr:hypothetical protein [Verrucomicrobiales bacterium]
MELDGLYQENIQKIREGAVKAGKLELVVACDAEIQAIGTSSTTKIEPRWGELVRVQKIYLENRKSRLTTARTDIEGLKSAAISKLKDAIVTLTQEENITEALKAQKLIGQLQAGGEIANARPGDESTLTHFNLEDGSYYGAKIGDTEEVIRAAFSANGLKLFKTSPMSNGSKNISANGINFRINNRGE